MALELHPEDVRAAIRKKFGTLAEFERVNRLPAQSVKDVLRGRTSKRIAKAIASELGVSSLILLPASRRGRTASRKKNTALNVDSQCLNAGGK